MCNMQSSCVYKTKVFVILLLIGVCTTGLEISPTERSLADTGKQEDGDETPQGNIFFLKQIFNKYGHQGIISFEGFEHLLQNLGLGRLVFEKGHSLSLHKVNGSFQEVHDSMRLHRHSHKRSSDSSNRKRRQVEDTQEYEDIVKSYSEPSPAVVPWINKCLTTQDILETFGLEPHHSLVISPKVFLNLCPAIVYELDQHLCYSETDKQTVIKSTVTQHSGWIYASASVLVISLIGLLGVTMVPLVQRTFYQQLLHFLVAMAVGTMCGDALLHLLPHVSSLLDISHSRASEHDHLTPILRAMVTFLAIGFFFLLEAVLRHLKSKSANSSKVDLRTQSRPEERRHLNENKDAEAIVNCEAETQPISQQHRRHQHQSQGSVAWMVIMGDGLHNLTDGLAVGAAFSGDTVAGFATALAVLCHELPHELGDFAVLLQAGMSIQKAILYNILSSVLSFIGMAAGVWIGEYEAASLWIYAFTAGAFLYISLVDLIPEMNNSENSQGCLGVILQLAGIITGAGIMLIIAVYEDDISSLFG